MKIEVHRCDRCGRNMELPDDTIYMSKDTSLFTNERDGQEIEFCCLCKESLRDWFNATESSMPGVISNEKTLRKERESTE